MRRMVKWRLILWLVAGFAVFSQQMQCRASDASTTQPAVQAKTGALDLTFTERSPLSTPKELARRLNLKESELDPDYDLSQKPFKAYIPNNYDPAKPIGVFVYLGYKDSVSTPPLWQPILEEFHLIFITPVCHSGTQYSPSVPLWQTAGLALDAVYNLKRQYAIDDKRIYLMSWVDQSTQVAIATADVFRGFVCVYDYGWFKKFTGNRLIYPATFSTPLGVLLIDAEKLPFFLIDDQSVGSAMETTSKVAAMRQFGFEHVMEIGLSSGDDLHYPNLKAEWFSQQVLPFLDKFSTAEHKSLQGSPAAATSTEAAPATTNPSGPSEAETLLAKAQLLMSNGRTDLARTKLQEIVQDYPADPAAAEAKKLLDQISNQ